MLYWLLLNLVQLGILFDLNLYYPLLLFNNYKPVDALLDPISLGPYIDIAIQVSPW